MAKYTKKIIKDTFIQLITEKSFDKITVKDIVESCEINRNTFYYYYKDIYDVLEEVFQEKTEKVIEEAGAVGNMYEEYAKAAEMVQTHKTAVIHLYHSKRRDVLEDYIKCVAFEFVKRSVISEAEKHQLSEEDKQYITHFYAYAIVGITMDWIKDGLPPYRESVLRKVSATYDVTIDAIIHACKTV